MLNEILYIVSYKKELHLLDMPLESLTFLKRTHRCTTFHLIAVYFACLAFVFRLCYQTDNFSLFFFVNAKNTLLNATLFEYELLGSR